MSPVTVQEPARGVPAGVLTVQVAPPGDAVTRKESGRPPDDVLPVTETEA